MKRADVIGVVQSRREELKALGVAHLYLFGSTARDAAGPDSDVDIFVDLRRGKRFSLFDLMDLRAYLSDTLKTKADVFLRQSLHRAIRHDIEADAVQVF